VTDRAGELFVGRTAELAQLHEELESARRGVPRVVLVEGRAGMGKTSLLRRFLAGANGVRVLRAGGDEAETRLPYGLVDQLAAGVSGLPTSLPASLSAAGRGPAAEPWSVGTGLVQLLGSLQGGGPVLVAVDDAHWADGASLAALAFALRRLRADAVMALVVGRPGAALPAGLTRLVDEGGGARIELSGFDVADVGKLAAGLGVAGLPRRSLDRLVEHTGGNPLHVRALLDELGPDGLRGPGPLPAPRAYSSLVVGRLAAVGEAARRLVTAAAVLGRRSPLGLAARVAGVERPGPALDEATGCGLLEAAHRSGSWEVGFPHPLVRAAVYDDLSPAERSALHARAAAQTSGAASLDHRVAAALVEDPVLAAELETRAGAEAASGAVSAAGQHLLAAARLSPWPADRERRLLEATRLLVLAGDAAEAAAHASELRGLPDSPGRDLVLGHLALLGGRLEEAEARLSAAWEGARRGPEAGHAAAQLAQLCLIQGRGGVAADWARRALAACPGEGPAVAALSRLLAGLTNAGRAAEARALVASLPERPPGDDPATVDALSGRGILRLWTDDPEGARLDLLAATTALRRWGQLKESAIFLAHLADAEYRLGRWDDSVAHGDQAASLAEDSDQAWLLGGTHSVVVFPLASRGHFELAEAHARRAVEASAALPEGEEANRGYAASAAAHLAWVQGVPGAVVEAVQPVLGFRNRAGSYEPGTMPWRELYAEALVALGRLDEAETVLRPYEELAEARGRRSSQAAAARARALLEAARGNPAGARAAFETALEHARALPTPFELAVVQHSYGAFLRRAGERRAALAHLSRARETFMCLGARPFVRRADRELAGTGLAPAPGSPVEGVALTPQEVAVSRLVAAGRTNKEVAAELVVSTKTVEYHLGNVFAKLGIRSRRELASRLR
jgi:ATP/maltotriose-dependent transcriptional regulator MalT